MKCKKTCKGNCSSLARANKAICNILKPLEGLTPTAPEPEGGYANANGLDEIICQLLDNAVNKGILCSKICANIFFEFDTMPSTFNFPVTTRIKIAHLEKGICRSFVRDVDDDNLFGNNMLVDVTITVLKKDCQGNVIESCHKKCNIKFVLIL